MNPDLIETICDGDLEELKKINNIDLTEKLTKQFVSIMEKNIFKSGPKTTEQTTTKPRANQANQANR